MTPWPVAPSNRPVPPEIIHRIVRQSFGRFRACYERGLMKNPNLVMRTLMKIAALLIKPSIWP